MAGSYTGGKDKSPGGNVGSDRPKADAGKTSESGGAGTRAMGERLSKAAVDRYQSDGKQTEGGGTGLHTQKAYTPGSVPAVADPSAGQMIGTFGPAMVPGGSLLNNATDIATGVAKGKVSDTPDGGLLGRAIDTATGGSPGLRTGWEPDRSRGAPGNPNDARGNTGSDLNDRIATGGGAGTAALQALTGDLPTPAADYSDVQLSDRRKSKMGAGTAMALAL